jgi:cell wall-associated NlpC family hydrolase
VELSLVRLPKRFENVENERMRMTDFYRQCGTAAVFVCALVLAGCSSAPVSRRAANGVAGGAGINVPSRISPEQASDVTIYAVGLVGTPYRYGGNTPDGGFDCSGLIGHVYQTRAGILAPRTVSKLQYWGQPVPADSIRSGDLVIFAPRDLATHAGIYVGGGRFVHAPSTGGKVRLAQLDSSYWASQTVTFRRP